MILKIKKKHWFNEPFKLNDNENSYVLSTCQKFQYNNLFSCFWCHIINDGIPLHCPLKFFPNQIEKSFSLKSGEGSYSIKGFTDNIENLKLINKEYYLVDGNFCSASCCLAFINDNYKNPKYVDSVVLLYKITKLENIVPAPHWKIRELYGGIFNDKQYKDLIINKEKYMYFDEILFVNHIFKKNLFS